MNYLDKTIEYISPRLATSRARERMRLRQYDGAAYSRRTKMFDKATSSGANLEVGTALVTLRNRSRWFVRNNTWAKRATQAISRNVVGEGIRPAPTGGTKNQIKKVKLLWKEWAESTNCDWNGKNTFYGLQSLAMQSIAEGGEAIIIKRRVMPTKSNPYPIKIQLIEGDQLDHTRDYQQLSNGSYCRLGIQFSKEGQIEGYWIYDNHPTDGINHTIELQSHFISVEDCVPIYEILRPGQLRGIPMGVSAFIKIGDFSDYEDAQLLRQKIASAFVAFIGGHEFDKSENSSLTEKLEPGLIQYLQENETVTFGTPPPAEGYGEYTKKILQGIAAAYGITYEMLTCDYSNVNFSSGRMAKIDISTNFRHLQYNMLVPQMCVPTWCWFSDACIMAGLMNTKLVCSATDWTAPKIQMLDPTKETNAIILALQAGLTTLGEVYRENGRDKDEVFAEIKAEREELTAMGINLSSIILSPEKINDNQQKNE